MRYSPTVYSAFAPPPKLQLSTWMEENIRLPAGDAAVPGKIRLYGYQRGIADAIGDPLIERVTVIKSARIGYTTILVGALANYVHNDPSSLLCLLPPGSGFAGPAACRRVPGKDPRTASVRQVRQSFLEPSEERAAARMGAAAKIAR